MNTLLLYPIFVPILIGLICLLAPRRFKGPCEALTVLTALASVVMSVIIFVQPTLSLHIPWLALTPNMALAFDFQSAAYARLTLLVVSIFALFAGVFSIPFLSKHARHNEYYAYFLMVLGVTSGAVLSENLLLLLFFWELHGFLLYLMAGINGDSAVPASTRTLILAGLGDLTLLFGLVLLWMQAGSFSINIIASHAIPVNTWPMGIAFVLMTIGTFVKVGVIPVHSWVTAITTETPMTVMGYFTSLDKMLGFYLLTVLTLSVFDLSAWGGWFLMTMGAITLLGGVLMAMVQSDYRKMLAFHAISQVGYMVLGIGTGTAIGIVGGLFHLVNMVIVKGALYLCGGSVQSATGKTKFSEMGGLAKAMPWTFASTLIASLAIAGVPPLNAFVSKWLVYQGIIERGGIVFPLYLLIAMFGSALTLASFMKLLYSMFWGDRPHDLADVKESPWMMTVPIFVLGLIAVAFGIFYRWPVDHLLAPILGVEIQPIGLWQSGLAVVLMIVSLLAGLIVYWAGRPRNHVESDVFLGGEALDPEIYRVPGTHFYGPVKAMNGLKQAYAAADRGSLDVYMICTRGILRAAQWIYQYIDQALADFYQEVIPALWSLIGQILRVFNANMTLTRIVWALYALGMIGVFFMPNQYEVITLTRIVACVGMIGWAFLAWVEGNLTRMLILATTSQLGFVVLGASLSSSVAISYMLTGSVAVALLFLSAYFIRRNLHTDKIDQMGGLAGKMPWVFLLFLIAALWLAGLPPFGSFFSKFLLGVAASEISPLLTIAITGTAILTLSYLLRPIGRFLRAK